MDLTALNDWFDRHHVAVVRTEGTSLDGAMLGKHLEREKFLASLPLGPAISDMALAVDVAGSAYLGFWHPYRKENLGDIYQRPDLATLIYDGADPDLGHCMVDYVDAAGNEIDVCPRIQLKRIYRQLQQEGLDVAVSFELEFFVYEESFPKARKRKYRDLTPLGKTSSALTYSVRDAHSCARFMKETIKRLEWQHMGWQAWNTEAAPGQLELNLTPCDPITAADHTMRIKQIIYEVARDLGCSATFMAKPDRGFGSGMHIHHSVMRDGEPVMYDDAGPSHRSQLMQRWIGGQMATLSPAVSILCPTVNSYRRLRDYAVAPTAVSWGEDNKTAALRVISASKGAARIEHRVGAADLNPYLALAVLLAGGLAGIKRELAPPDEFTMSAWSLPEAFAKLPNTIVAASEALEADELLADYLGQDFLDYWINTRRWEWLMFRHGAKNPATPRTTDWERQRYFELV